MTRLDVQRVLQLAVAVFVQRHRQKLAQFLRIEGSTCLGVCARKSRVATQRHLMQAVGYRGALDTGVSVLMLAMVNKLLDVNPRIGSTFRFFAAEKGWMLLGRSIWTLRAKPFRPDL
jgi:predicted ATP-grasp superfamily ATP-dependent carboligase